MKREIFRFTIRLFGEQFYTCSYYRIQDKLSIGTKQELVIWAVRNGLVDDVELGADAQPTPEGQ